MRRLYKKGSVLARSFLLLLLFVTVSTPLYAAGSDSDEPGTDLRVLIDVSGSMKRTDPENLRAPALRMLVGLLPESSKSGVWSFGKLVNMSVPHGMVNDAWRERARKESKNIHSLGLFTNIEDALKKASAGWEKPDAATNRTLILLSDGMVDISRDDNENLKSRNRILNTILPNLKNSGVVIHTVALSDQADEKLLEALAVSTDGWFEKITNAKKLQKVFLRLFEKSAPVDKLPLQENLFEVDESIEDMTLLVFREKGDKQTRIVSPGGKSFDKDTHPKNFRWHHENDFDLITVNQPAPGGWKMDSRIDNENRVMVVTNLKLKVSKQPNHLLLGENYNIFARLYQDKKAVKESKLLKQVEFLYNIGSAHDKLTAELLRDDGKKGDKKAGDGVYSVKIDTLEKGKRQVSVMAEGPTFKREYFNVVNVHDSPLVADIKQRKEGAPAGFLVSLKALRIKGLSVDSFEVTSKGKALKTDIKPTDKNKWQFSVSESYSNKPLNISYMAKVGKRNAVRFSVKLDVPEYVGKSDVVNESENTEDKETAAEKQSAESKDVSDDDEGKSSGEIDHEEEIKALSESLEGDVEGDDLDVNAKEEFEKKTGKRKEEEDIHWILVLAMVMMVNALLGLAGVGGYFFWKKRREKSKPMEEAEVTYE